MELSPKRTSYPIQNRKECTIMSSYQHIIFRTHKYFVFKHPLGVKSSNTSEIHNRNIVKKRLNMIMIPFPSICKKKYNYII